MALAAKQLDDFITEQEYLSGEKISEIRHEYIDGRVYAMAVASRYHGLISNNISRELGNQLIQKKSPCDIFSSDMKVKVTQADSRFYYPDVVIVCEENEDNYHYTDNPILIVEVLSNSTERMDKTMKMMDYTKIPSLQEYVLISQNRCQIQVMRRKNHWRSFFYFLGDTIHFDSIDVNLSVETIYYRVNNAEMSLFHHEKTKQKPDKPQ